MTQGNSVRARKPFRILAGFIVLFAICSCAITISIIPDHGANVYVLLSIILAAIFILEFGCVAFKGDGFHFYNSKRVIKRKPKGSDKIKLGIAFAIIGVLHMSDEWNSLMQLSDIFVLSFEEIKQSLYLNAWGYFRGLTGVILLFVGLIYFFHGLLSCNANTGRTSR